jgi:RNA polymerase sigma factor (sigma-70 family)
MKADETDPSLEAVVLRARAGERIALELIVAGIQDRVYAIAFRMLWHPEDAHDATQEILLRVITHLADFRGDSSLMTWVYRVAANHLISVRRSRVEREQYTFERFGRELDEGLAEPPTDLNSAERLIMMEEVKIGCTLGMLQCLDRPHRLAYILGEILDLDTSQAAAILGVSAAAFRKRLSRARAVLVDFTRRKCGLVEPSNRCRCRLRIGSARAAGRIDPGRPRFAFDSSAAARFPEVLKEIRGLDEVRRAVALYRSANTVSTKDFVPMVREILASRT